MVLESHISVKWNRKNAFGVFLFNGCAPFASFAHCDVCVTINPNDKMPTYSDFSFRGLAGAIFICLVFASILYVIGFATTAWAINKDSTGLKQHDGLWERCVCRYNKDIDREGKSPINTGSMTLLCTFTLHK